MKNFLIAFVGVMSVIYLLNPSFGIFELLPDVIPGIGNIDEAAATALLLSSLAYFGIDLRSFFGRKNEVVRDAEIIENDKKNV